MSWFDVARPTLLVALLAGLALIAALLRTERVHPQWSSVQRWGAVLLGAVGALLLGAALSAMDTPIASFLLMLAAIGAAVLATVESCRRRPSGAPPESAAWAGLFRIVSWAALLCVAARPGCRWIEYEHHRPLLVALLDGSESMGLPDRAATSASRADVANAALRAAADRLERLEQFYEVQRFRFGDGVKPGSEWTVTPSEPATSLAGALRSAAAARSSRGDPPTLALVLSDGAENVADARVVRQAATELSTRGVRLIAVGVGDERESVSQLTIDPLPVPQRVGLRDRLSIAVTGRVTACEGQTLRIALGWNDEPPQSRELRVRTDDAPLYAEFATTPPAIGVQRLTARVTLPPALGGRVVERTALVDVREDRIRVLVVDAQPRIESAFLTRALSSDPRFEVAQQSLQTTSATPLWETFDVVMLAGAERAHLGAAALNDLAAAVRLRGVGLALLGDAETFAARRIADTALAEISPVDFGVEQRAERPRASPRPSRGGALHAIVALDSSTEEPSAPWRALDGLSTNVRLGRPKPLAQTLLQSAEDDAPLLVVHDIGKGRAAASALESTWTWATHSDEGHAAHRRYWRQLVAWLANRKPSAWVLADRQRYVRAAIASGHQTIRVRAGVTETDGADNAASSARLTLRRTPEAHPAESRPTAATGSWNVSLRRDGREWTAELPAAIASGEWLGAGAYELDFSLDSGGGRDPLSARTTLHIDDVRAEFAPPTSNLELLREAADATAERGGRYEPISRLSEALDALMEHDPRRRVERRMHYDAAERQPALLFALLVGGIAVEWLIRRRIGMR